MKPARIAVSLLAVILLIWFVNKGPVNPGMKALESAKPAFKTADKVSRKINPLTKSKRSRLSEEQKLYAKVKVLEASLARMEELSLENERLREMLDFRKRASYKTIPAEVIGRDPSNWTNIIYIDKGRDQGIAPKMGVATTKGVIGRVIDAESSVAKVMLINDPDSRIAAHVQRSRETGLVCGTLSRRCRMIYISPDADVKIGDAVVTSPSGETFAGGLLIGTIIDLFEDKGGLYRSAIINPAADLQRLEEVLCIK